MNATLEKVIQDCAVMCESALISAELYARKDRLIERDFWRARAQAWALIAFRAATA